MERVEGRREGRNRNPQEGRAEGERGEESTGIFLFVTFAPFYPALTLSPWEGSAQLGVFLLSVPGNPEFWIPRSIVWGGHCRDSHPKSLPLMTFFSSGSDGESRI